MTSVILPHVSKREIDDVGDDVDGDEAEGELMLDDGLEEYSCMT